MKFDNPPIIKKWHIAFVFIHLSIMQNNEE